MKTNYILIAIIIYLIFFRRQKFVVPSATLRSVEFEALEKDYIERIDILEKSLEKSLQGNLA